VLCKWSVGEHFFDQDCVDLLSGLGVFNLDNSCNEAGHQVSLLVESIGLEKGMDSLGLEEWLKSCGPVQADSH
jgi:hypothetical protein